MNKLVIVTILCLLTISLSGQSVESFMEKVLSNNPDLAAAEQLLNVGMADSKIEELQR